MSAYAELRLLVLGRLFLHFLTGLLDSLAGRRGGVRSGITSRIHCVAGGVHGGIARSRSGITGSVSGLTSRSCGIGSSVLRCLNGFLLGAARDSQGSEGSGKSDLGVHQNVPRVMSMDVWSKQQVGRPPHAVRYPLRGQNFRGSVQEQPRAFCLLLATAAANPLEGVIQRLRLSGKMTESTAPGQAHDRI